MVQRKTIVTCDICGFSCDGIKDRECGSEPPTAGNEFFIRGTAANSRRLVTINFRHARDERIDICDECHSKIQTLFTNPSI